MMLVGQIFLKLWMVVRLSEVEKEFHDYIMEEYRSGEQDFGDIIRIPLDPICRMNLR